MASAATSVPAETDTLCERCGYVLNGLPPDSRCPECGTPIEESDARRRHAPEWEQVASTSSVVARFMRTSAEVLFRPTHFYRTFATRVPRTNSQQFARLHWAFAALLFGAAAVAHLRYAGVYSNPRFEPLLFVAVAILTYLFLAGLTWLAAKLTNWEATYRGLRLPFAAVRRGMDYHAAHYVPVALAAAVTVVGYGYLITHGQLDAVRSAVPYLYVLCAEVIVAAFYLFVTYWTAMRNMMYANA